MLTAMLTGDRSYLQRGVRVGFERTGSFHLLVVSGLHLAIFSGLIFWVARRLGLSRVWASLITIGCSLGYAVFTGFGNPVQRAFWMVTLYLIGRLLWRERVALNVIGVAALVMLAADPSSLFDSGFQMTLLSVLAVAGIAVPVAEKTFGPYLRAMRNLRVLRIDPSLPPQVAQFRVSLRMVAQYLRPLTGRFAAWTVLPVAIRLGLRAAELLVVSFSIELLMMLPMAAYFHRVTLLALPVNLLIVPFLGVLLPLRARDIRGGPDFPCDCVCACGVHRGCSACGHLDRDYICRHARGRPAHTRTGRGDGRNVDSSCDRRSLRAADAPLWAGRWGSSRSR